MQETADLVKFTEEILNRKLHFLCSECFILNFDSSKRVTTINRFQVCSSYTFIYPDVSVYGWLRIIQNTFSHFDDALGSL